MLQIGQCLIEFSLSEFKPAQGVEICAVIRTCLERELYHLLGFIEVHIVLGPHVGEIIVRIRGIAWIDRDRFSKKVRRLIKKAGLLSRCAIIEIKTRVRYLGALGFSFMQRFFECGDGFLGMFCFTESDRKIVDDFWRLPETLARLRKYLDGAFRLLHRAEKNLS